MEYIITSIGLLGPILIWIIFSMNKQIEELQEDNRLLRMEAERLVALERYDKEKNNN